MKGVKRFLFISVLLFSALLVPRNLHALSFTVTRGLSVEPQSFTIGNGGDEWVTYRVFSHETWINPSPGGYISLEPGEERTVEVYVNPYGLPYGMHEGSVHIIELPGGSGSSENVTLNYLAPVITIHPRLIEMEVTQGLYPDPQYFTLSNTENTGNGSLVYFIRKDVNWITAWFDWQNYGSGGVLYVGEEGDVKVSVNPYSLPVGTHTGTITISAFDVTEEITVRLTVLAPVITVHPGLINIQVTQGLSLNPRYFTLENMDNTGNGYLVYSIRKDVNWISASFDWNHGRSGTLSVGEEGDVKVSVNPYNLSVGTHTGNITISTFDSTEDITVRLTVLEPQVPVNPGSLSFPYNNQPDPYTKSFTVGNFNREIGSLVYRRGIEYTDPPGAYSWMRADFGADFPNYLGAGWLFVGQEGSIKVTVNPAGLAEGTYKGNVIVYTGAVTKKVPVTLRVGGCEPLASLKKGEVWPQNAGSKETSTKVKVELEQPAPPGGCTIELKVEAVPYSGWHSHDSRPDGKVGTLNKYEVEFLEGESEPQYVTYTSYEISGEENIYYREKREEGVTVETDGDTISVSGPEKWEDYVTIRVMVPDLMPLPTGGYLITMHTTPEPSKYHAVSQSNYCTIYTALSVVDAVEAYAKEFNLHPDVKLAVIDMSLPWGGLFDIYGNWSTPHTHHRKGTMADFSKHYRDKNGNTYHIAEYRNGKFVKDTAQIDQEKLDDYFDKQYNRCTRADEPQIHYNCIR